MHRLLVVRGILIENETLVEICQLVNIFKCCLKGLQAALKLMYVYGIEPFINLSVPLTF